MSTAPAAGGAPPPPPPPPPGGGAAPPPPGPAAAAIKGGASGAETRFNPPLLLFFVSLTMLIATVVFWYLGGEWVPCRRAAACEPVYNAAGFLGGALVGFVPLGWFIALDNRRRALKLGNSISWLRKWMTGISIGACLLGLWHMFGFALYLSRLL